VTVLLVVRTVIRVLDPSMGVSPGVRSGALWPPPLIVSDGRPGRTCDQPAP
jgi:hypothetical protein